MHNPTPLILSRSAVGARLGALAACLVCLSATAPARADLVQHVSLEWHTASSTNIAEAVVVGIDPARGCPDGQHVSLQREGAPLKGSPQTQFSALWVGEPLAVGDRVLAFVTPGGAPRACRARDGSGGQGRWSGDVMDHAIVAHSGQWSAISRRATRLRGLDALRAAIQAAAPTDPAPLTPVKMSWPVLEDTELAREHGMRDAVSLVVPRDAEAEPALVLLLESDVAAHRVLAAQLIAEFQSVANIERLLKLRDDPAFVVLDGERRYWVRDAAEHTLTRWRVPLPPR